MHKMTKGSVGVGQGHGLCGCGHSCSLHKMAISVCPRFYFFSQLQSHLHPKSKFTRSQYVLFPFFNADESMDVHQLYHVCSNYKTYFFRNVGWTRWYLVEVEEGVGHGFPFLLPHCFGLCGRQNF